MKLSLALIATIEASHTATGAVTYTGSYLRGVTVSISAADPNSDTGAKRVKVNQTYNWRRNVAGYGNTGCTQNDIDKGRSSKHIGPSDPLNSSKYHKGRAMFFSADDADGASLESMMDTWGGSHQLVPRVGDSKELTEWKLKYKVTDFKAGSANVNDDWCLGSVEDVFEVNSDDASTFSFQNRYEGGTNWMVIVSDTTAGREMNYGVTSGKDIYEKYRFGAAMLNLDVRADTGKINSSPVATLPGEFLMQASCKNSYTVQMSDPDGDTIKCRWATNSEATDFSAKYRVLNDRTVTDFPALSLDEETCTVTYDGSLDEVCTGSETYEHLGGSMDNPMKWAGANSCYKPFALIIEDFDSDGNVLSSIPLTFFGQVVPKSGATCPGEEEESTHISLDEDKQSAMLEKFVTEPASGDWGINGSRYNKIYLAAKFMDRFTSKFCGWGSMTQEKADAWYAIESDLEANGHDLLEFYLADCKDSLVAKAKTKWTKIVNGLEAIDAKIIAKNEKKGL